MADLDDIQSKLDTLTYSVMAVENSSAETNELLKQVVSLLKRLIDETKKKKS